MDKNATLRIVNPLLGILLLNQPFSIILKALTGWDVFEVSAHCGRYRPFDIGGHSRYVELGLGQNEFLEKC